MQPRLVWRAMLSRASKQKDSLNSMAKGTFPLTALLLKGRESLLCLFSMKIVVSFAWIVIAWWQRSQSLPGVAEDILINPTLCVTKKNLILLAEDSSNFISHEAFWGGWRIMKREHSRKGRVLRVSTSLQRVKWMSYIWQFMNLVNVMQYLGVCQPRWSRKSKLDLCHRQTSDAHLKLNVSSEPGTSLIL